VVSVLLTPVSIVHRGNGDSFLSGLGFLCLLGAFCSNAFVWVRPCRDGEWWMCWLPARFPFLFLLQKGVLLDGDRQIFRVFTENYDLSGQARMRIM
jgi:hypothetical protein